MTYQVNEIFDSIQGEGIRSGLWSTFIRLAGCHVGCPWCDTKYAWKAGSKDEMSTDAILAKVTAQHAVITGGEPGEQELSDLVIALLRAGKHIQLETSGSGRFDFPGPVWITWSPKKNLGYRPSSDLWYRISEVKWVVDDDLTFDTVVDTFRSMVMMGGQKFAFTLMPEGATPEDINRHAQTIFKWLALPDAQNWLYTDRLQWRLNIK
jgi:7-carboxy-7-deazaguanine synthase